MNTTTEHQHNELPGCLWCAERDRKIDLWCSPRCRAMSDRYHDRYGTEAVRVIEWWIANPDVTTYHA